MKNLSGKLILLFFGMLALIVATQAQIPTGILDSFQKGDDVKLASFFNENVELEVLTHKDVYSKAQARQIVAEFFKANKPKQFSIIRQDKKEGARYAMGSLKTNTGVYRVYFLLKTRDNKSYIHQLRIWR